MQSTRALLHSRHVVPIAHSAKFDYRLRLSLRMTRYFLLRALLSDDTLFVCVVLFLSFYTDAPHPTPHHPTPSGVSPQGEAFQSIIHAKLTFVSGWGGGTHALAGAIALSAL